MNTTKRFALMAAALGLAVAACTATGSADSSSDTTGPATTDAVVAEDTGSSSVASDPSGVAASTSLDRQDSHYDEGDLNWNEADEVAVTLTGTSATDGDGVSVDGNTVVVNVPGTYRITGTLDGQILVDSAADGLVRLVLDGVTIVNDGGAAIAVVEADEVVVVLADGSNNALTDGSDYIFPDADTDEPNATLYSAANMTIGGSGSLAVTGLYNDAITSKDGLVIVSGSITVDAVDDGIRGKDYVIVHDASITIDAGGDGIKADNDEDAERGYVLVLGGDTVATAGGDGIDAATSVELAGGSLEITTGGGASGNLSADLSAKGVKGDVAVVINGADVTVDSADDGIHSNGTIEVVSGTISVATGDDGIHADDELTILDGVITITESYEGLESAVIRIEDGTIDITSADDGINAAGGATTEAVATDAGVPGGGVPGGGVPGGGGPGGGGPGGGGPGGGGEVAGDYYVYINGGSIVITVNSSTTADGDGIDSNGHIVMTGGVVVVNGPTDTRNSAVDYNGTFEVSGGLFIGTNIDGRNSEGVGAGSTQASIYITSGSVVEAGTVIHIQTTDGEGLVTFEAANTFDVISFTSPDLVDGETYEIYLGGSVSGDSTNELYEDTAYTPGELVGTATATL